MDFSLTPDDFGNLNMAKIMTLEKHLKDYQPPENEYGGWLGRLDKKTRDELLKILRLFHAGKLTHKFADHTKLCKWMYKTLKNEKRLPTPLGERTFVDGLRGIE